VRTRAFRCCLVFALIAGLLPLLAIPAAADLQCTPDATGDTVRQTTQGQNPENHPQADITEVCARYGEEKLRFSTTAVSPADPNSATWSTEDSGLWWFVRINGQTWTVRYMGTDDSSKFRGVVADPAGKETCGTNDFDGLLFENNTYRIGAPARCFGDPSSIEGISGRLDHDPEPEAGSTGPFWLDPGTPSTPALMEGEPPPPPPPPPPAEDPLVCTPDPAGDVEPQDLPRVDITEACVRLTSSELRVSMNRTENADPTQQDGDLNLYWHVGTNGATDFEATYEVEFSDGTSATVRRPDGTIPEGCDLMEMNGQYDGAQVRLTSLPRSCFDEPSSISAIYADSEYTNRQGTTYTDVTDNFPGFEEPTPARGLACVADPTGDTVRVTTEGASAESRPRADITELCTRFNPGELRFSMRIAEPFDSQDAAWDSDDTGMYFRVGIGAQVYTVHYYRVPADKPPARDPDGGGGEFIIGKSAPSRLRTVISVRDGSDSLRCDSTDSQGPTIDGDRYSFYVPAACFRNPAQVDFVSAEMNYDPRAAAGDTGPYNADFAGTIGALQPEEASNYQDPAPLPPPPPPAPEPGPTRPTSRLEGPSRIDTAIAISQSENRGTAGTVYLARADEVVDAVAAGSVPDGPILFVPPCGELPPAVAAEIDRLSPGRVVAIGGESAVCEGLLQAAASGRPTDRFGGTDRLSTAVAISRGVFPEGAGRVFLARADVFADAVAGGALQGGPVLLVPSCGPVPDVVADELARLGATEVRALGGTTAVCDELLTAAGGDLSTGRLAGVDRFTTAAQVARFAFADRGVSTVYLARADVFADAVAGGTLTAGPVLLVPSCGELPEVVAQAIRDSGAGAVVALGSAGAVCDDMLARAGAS